MVLAVAQATAGGPRWTDKWTAYGTVGAVVVALGIALFTDWRAGRRIKDERDRSARLLREERERSAAALAEQRAHEGSALDEERAYGRAQLEEERRLELERRQLGEAYMVEVAFGEHDPGQGPPNVQGNRAPSEVRQLAVMVMNRTSFTITQVEAKFCVGNAMVSQDRYERVSAFMAVPPELRARFTASPERPLFGVLAPWDTGIRFEIDPIHGRELVGWYPVVRWTDRWGTRWEHKRGVVRRVGDADPWEP
jgi:hypothetical protein